MCSLHDAYTDQLLNLTTIQLQSKDAGQFETMLSVAVQRAHTQRLFIK